MSGKNISAAEATMLAAEIAGNGAISKFKFDVANDSSKSVTMETSMVEADFSGKNLRGSGTIMLSAFLPKCT
jgi:hypothetical protein